jgi:UDPglucose 6-dehydrogenase
MSEIAVLGAGYVGLTTAVCLSSLGHSVVVSDVNHEKITNLNSGKCPIFEESLEELLQQCIEESRIRFISNNCDAVKDSDYVFLCLPTPEGELGEADMQFVLSVIDEVRTHFRSGAIVITKSTVPIGASADVFRRIGRDDVSYVSNPEFLREG